MGLWYTKDSGFKLTGFLDADYAGCKDTFKSTFGRAQILGEMLLTDYSFHFNNIPVYCDSKSAIAISCNPVQHSRTKHITVRYHFIKEYVEKGTIELYFVKTDYQLADLFTKALLMDRFKYLIRRLGRAEVEEDDREQACFRDGKISSGRKKSQGPNIGDSDNTGDEGKTVGGAIGACGGISDSLLVALYACMTFIYESSWKGDMASEAKRYLDKSSEVSGKVFPGEAGNQSSEGGI
nr:hypothetical protein [Tanacetum cinerariifolium]